MKFDKNKHTLGSVESFTGGLFASTIVSKPGASKYFKGSLITYSNEIKNKFGIDTSNGVVNKNVSYQMALMGKKILNVDFCVSFTGNAGPSVLDGKEIGEVFIAINDFVFKKNFTGSRNTIRKNAVDFIIKELNI